MGASNGYCRPISNPTGLSTWTAHTNRGVPSTEPGTDYYTPSGTPVLAAASGVVVDTGDSVYPATGRFVTIDLDDGRRVRYLHLSRRRVSYGDRVQWGQHIADSGASGYGSDFFGEPYRNAAFWNNTGGDHVHMTLWAGHYYQFGRYATLDPELYMSSNQGGSGSNVSKTRKLLTKEESMEFFNIQGQGGSHNAGLFATYRKNSDGTLVAKRLTRTIVAGYPTIPNEGLVELRKAMPFIDL